jgi:hypothetical protein
LLTSVSDTKAEVNNIPNLNDVFPGFESPFTSFFGTILSLVANVVIARNHLCTDETFLKVYMNDTGRLGSSGFLLYSPGSDFL